MKKIQILKVLVGSRAHGIHEENADYDYRGVYIEPTSQILSMGYKSKGVSWVEGETEDQTSYELLHFLKLAMLGHPNILEMFFAPVVECTADGERLLKLYPDIWCPQKAYTSFNNYADNRKKHMITTKDNKVALKSAYCYLRVVHNLLELVRDGSFSMKIDAGRVRCLLSDVKSGFYSPGQVIDIGETVMKDCEAYLEDCNQKQNPELIHKFYLEMRKKYWE